METKEDMISTPELNEAFCDAWAMSQKPDDVYEWYAKCSMGYRTEPLELFRQAFKSGSAEADRRELVAHENGYEIGHDDGMQRGRQQGVLEVMAVVQGGDWPEVAKQVAACFPDLWREAVCQHNTRDGDGS